MWVTPKTDWQPTDTVSLSPDYARIRGNLLHLADMAQTLYPPFTLEEMDTATTDSLPTRRFFERVDTNTTLLQTKTCPAKAVRPRTYQDNAPCWNADDLNRIETAALTLYRLFCAQANGQKHLAFTLGGGTFVP